MPHRNVTIAYERIKELEAENTRLKSEIASCCCGSLGQRMKRAGKSHAFINGLQSENAKLRDAFSECVSVKDEFNRSRLAWKSCAEKAEALLTSEIENCSHAKRILEEQLNYRCKQVDKLKALLASGILLKRHSAEERPEKDCQILIQPLIGSKCFDADWLKEYPNLLYTRFGAFAWGGMECWYGPIELPEE